MARAPYFAPKVTVHGNFIWITRGGKRLEVPAPSQEAAIAWRDLLEGMLRESAHEDGWISVEERLPAYNARVLFLHNGQPTIGWRIGDGWIDESDTYDDVPQKTNDVSHWRPLPPAPEKAR